MSLLFRLCYEPPYLLLNLFYFAPIPPQILLGLFIDTCSLLHWAGLFEGRLTLTQG